MFLISVATLSEIKLKLKEQIIKEKEAGNYSVATQLSALLPTKLQNRANYK